MKKSIMCPNCRKFMTTIDENAPMPSELACRKCWKLIKWTDEGIRICGFPKRTTSSGMRFY